MRVRGKSKFEKICRKAVYTDFYYYVLSNQPVDIDEAAKHYGVSKGYISKLVRAMKPLISRWNNRLFAKSVDIEKLNKVIDELSERSIHEVIRNGNISDQG